MDHTCHVPAADLQVLAAGSTAVRPHGCITLPNCLGYRAAEHTWLRVASSWQTAYGQRCDSGVPLYTPALQRRNTLWVTSKAACEGRDTEQCGLTPTPSACTALPPTGIHVSKQAINPSCMPT